MTEYCNTCKVTPLHYDSEFDCGQCYDCQDRAIAKYQRVREWYEYLSDWHDEQEAGK